MDFGRPMSLVMDDRGSQPHPRSTSLRVSTKTKAPSPPGLKTADCSGFSQWHPGDPRLTMDQKENLMDKELSLIVVLPGGIEKNTQVEGSKPLMDLLVTLCAKYHLNPSSHTLELVTANKNSIKLKPNALIGTLDAEKIILKPKGEDKNKKAGPQMPEATVRMVINYKKTQKTVLRVNPRVPLRELLPAICEKCEFDTETTVLLRDVTSSAPLDLSGSLNDYAIREVYARDAQGQVVSPVCLRSPVPAGLVTPGKDKIQKEKENKGLFSKFRKSKKKPDQPTTVSAPASPVLVSKPRPLSMALPCSNSTPIDSSAFSDVPKKRRAPQPPILASQSGHSDFAARQRINSEPSTQLDGIQRSPVSRGSSAESSLRRTKRKAPAPPTSPNVDKTLSEEEHTQATAVSSTLQEIREQEEAAGSVSSSAAPKTLGENGILTVTPESSLLSPSPDAESGSTVEAGGEDQCLDLSSDGKRVDGTVNDSAAQGVKINDTNSFEPTTTDNVAVQVDDVHPQPVCKEPKADGNESGLLPSVKKDAEVQASSDANPEPPRELPDGSTSSVATSTQRPAGEDAPAKTDSTGLSGPPQQHVDKVSLSTAPVTLLPAEKKDMSTSTEELEPSELSEGASLHTSSTSPCDEKKPSVPAPKKASFTHAADPELKPKPSNELTRDYIPKVGMTTYTIVPQKSLERHRYFEVALTLEAPRESPGEELDSVSPGLKGDQGQTVVLREKTELNSNLPRDDSLSSTNNTTTTFSTTTLQHTVNGSTPEPPPPPPSPPVTVQITDKISSANEASQAGSPTEVKDVKIPPATKPKPASFRLAQHKKTPGFYVTSAAEKSLGATPASGLQETQGSPDRAGLPSPPLAPPLPLAQCQEETAEAAGVQLSPKQDDKNVASMRVMRQSSLPSRELGARLSLEKFRSFAAPRPFAPSTPSRFAQAVSSAVKRSQSLSHGPKSPPSKVSPPVSPITSPSSVIQSKGLSELKQGEEVTQMAKETGL